MKDLLLDPQLDTLLFELGDRAAVALAAESVSVDAVWRRLELAR